MNNEKLTLGEKLAGARKSAGLTQRELAEKLTVSRQAVAKWESNGGMPDIENLRRLSKLLNVSIDYLLDDGKTLDFSVTREGIDLDKYVNSGTNSKRRYAKSDKKYMAVLEMYRD
ncbi:MAG: helix-turn-helix domain-containing protein, partial [Firmicutes bacterium]|nr:helix-turn-helix domain-containing protein [Bacillota bacterium]